MPFNNLLELLCFALVDSGLMENVKLIDKNWIEFPGSAKLQCKVFLNLLLPKAYLYLIVNSHMMC